MSERFDRHRLIPGWRQEHLSNASVIVVGMGALGNEVTRILAMTGVGNLILCDPDRIEASNLSRTSLFRQRDIGRFKVDAAAAALEDLAPGIHVQARAARLNSGVGLAEIRDASLVLGCLDSRTARLELAGRCNLVRAPSIDGGTHPWGGEVRPYLDPDGQCYGCSLSMEERSIVDAPWSCLDVVEPSISDSPAGSAAPSSALVGTWMGMLAIRYLMGESCPSEILSIDGTRGTTSLVQIQPDPGCPLHQRVGTVMKIDVGSNDTVSALRKALPEQAVPLAWDAVQHREECPNCGFMRPYWGIPRVNECPRCHKMLRPRTTLEFAEAPPDLPLIALGIAPREIMAVRSSGDWLWVELNA